MSINGIYSSPTSLSLASAAAESSASSARVSARTSADTATASADTGTANASDTQPATPRFPWLSRLSTQLAAASNTPSKFAAPILGDNLDKKA